MLPLLWLLHVASAYGDAGLHSSEQYLQPSGYVSQCCEYSRLLDSGTHRGQICFLLGGRAVKLLTVHAITISFYWLYWHWLPAGP